MEVFGHVIQNTEIGAGAQNFSYFDMFFHCRHVIEYSIDLPIDDMC